MPPPSTSNHWHTSDTSAGLRSRRPLAPAGRRKRPVTGRRWKSRSPNGDVSIQSDGVQRVARRAPRGLESSTY